MSINSIPQPPTFYMSDTGHQDQGKQLRLSADTPWVEIEKKAHEHKAHLIIRLPLAGTWYIKGGISSKKYPNGKNTFSQIKTKLEANQAAGPYKKREAWLINYLPDSHESS